MIKIDWHEPNFECDVELGTDRVWRLAWGETKAHVKQRFEERGYKVHGVKPYDFAKGWKKLADDATKEVKKSGKPAEWKKEIWTAIKAHLFDLSNGKCGYCEGAVKAVSAGEVEHYRPKGKVHGDGKHGGYFWLAYEISNYVPTCSQCNSGKGKLNQFPISGKRVSAPGADLKSEKALLIHPFETDPRRHLRILAGDSKMPDYAMVVAVAGSAQGSASRKVYNLNRGDLLMARREAMSEASQLFLMLRMGGGGEAKKTFDRIVKGELPYSVARMAKLAELFEEKRKSDQLLQNAVLDPLAP
jgi:hypothetical protein